MTAQDSECENTSLMPALQPHFVHLHVHSEYSVYDSLVRIEDLIDFCERDQARAIALTDQMNLFGLVKFYQAAEKKKIKPIIGADLLIYAPQFPNKHFRMLVLCKNNQGYDLLKKIISKAYLEGYDTLSGKAMDQSWLWDAACSGHLILIAPSFYGEVYQTWKQNKWDQAEAILQTWQAQFPGDYFLEITRISGEQELEFNKMLLNWAQKHQIPCVASNQVRFVETLDFEAHEARVCINQGYTLEDKTRPKHYTDEQYLRSTSEMQDLFSFCPSALENSVQIAYRCNVTLKFGEVFLPNFLTPNQMPITQYLSALSQAGLEKILQKNPKPEQIKASYFKRLEIELKVINDMGFAGYF
ncbi:MAG: PHP domain-containing protein, partial [Gammaproteobacteria bacterium]